MLKFFWQGVEQMKINTLIVPILLIITACSSDISQPTINNPVNLYSQ
jgi:hypothetical protein